MEGMYHRYGERAKEGFYSVIEGLKEYTTRQRAQRLFDKGVALRNWWSADKLNKSSCMVEKSGRFAFAQVDYYVTPDGFKFSMTHPQESDTRTVELAFNNGGELTTAISITDSSFARVPNIDLLAASYRPLLRSDWRDVLKLLETPVSAQAGAPSVTVLEKLSYFAPQSQHPAA